jgi:hypothetical protein
MRRIVLLAFVGLSLVSFPGCAKWKQKHFYRSAYVEGDACGCGTAYAGTPVVGAHPYDNYVAGPSSAVISAPAKGPLPAPQF